MVSVHGGVGMAQSETGEEVRAGPYRCMRTCLGLTRGGGVGVKLGRLHTHSTVVCRETVVGYTHESR